MHRPLRRFARRLVALAPVIAALGGQALAAGSLRAPYLPHAGTTPAPDSSSVAAGIAALRRATHDARRSDLEARLGALLRSLPETEERSRPSPMSGINDIAPPGSAPCTSGSGSDVTR